LTGQSTTNRNALYVESRNVLSVMSMRPAMFACRAYNQIAPSPRSQFRSRGPPRTVVLRANVSVPSNGVALNRDPACSVLPSRIGSATRLSVTALSLPP
jgi:hypothetical protein